MQAVENRIKHPLEPLTTEEITQVVAILREKKELSEKARFAQVTLNEPEKEVVVNYKEGDQF
jgi:primary-amine oxidase